MPEHYRVWRRDDGSWWQPGRGTVYKATDLRSAATVALRVFDAGPRTPDAMGALAEYAATLARPGSPLVAPLRDFFVSGAFNVAATGWIEGESLAERVRRGGPLGAEAAWTVARQLLEALASLHALGIAHGNLAPSKILFPADGEPTRPLVLVEAGLHPSASVAADPAAGSGSTREDLRRLGATLWFALTGDPLETSPDEPVPWQKLAAAGITPSLGALPVLLARTLTSDPAHRPATAPALMETLNVLASLGSTVPSLRTMPSPAPSDPDPIAPAPEPHPLVAAEGELWTRPSSQLTTPNRRRKKSGSLFRSVLLVLAGGVPGFVGGVAYERNHLWLETAWPPGWLSRATRAASSSTPTPPQATPEPDMPLPPSPAVSPGGVAARLDRIQSLQPEVRDILKYARELRRVATAPLAAANPYPTDAQIARLRERFDWTDPASPNAHRTPLILVLGYAPGPTAASQQVADAMAQALAQHRIISPIYTCGLGDKSGVPEIEPAGAAHGPFIEVWVAFTLF